MKEKAGRILVTVDAQYTREGAFLPRSILMPDGRPFKITDILDAHRDFKYGRGRAGICFICVIGGTLKELFYDDTQNPPQWFVEGF